MPASLCQPPVDQYQSHLQLESVGIATGVVSAALGLSASGILAPAWGIVETLLWCGRHRSVAARTGTAAQAAAVSAVNAGRQSALSRAMATQNVRRIVSL